MGGSYTFFQWKVMLMVTRGAVAEPCKGPGAHAVASGPAVMFKARALGLVRVDISGTYLGHCDAQHWLAGCRLSDFSLEPGGGLGLELLHLLC